MKTKIKSFVILSVAVLALVVTGCRHTAHGVGEDVEKVGEKIQDKTN